MTQLEYRNVARMYTGLSLIACTMEAFVYPNYYWLLLAVTVASFIGAAFNYWKAGYLS